MTEKYYVYVPVLEMRKEPDNRTEVVSQGLFSEEIQLLEEKKNWFRIKTLVDNYTGWVGKEGICRREIPYGNEVQTVAVDRLSAHLYERPDTIFGPILTLPFESRLAVADFKEDDNRWLTVLLLNGVNAYIQRGDIVSSLPFLDKKSVCSFSKKFLGLPYTWGGRSSFGYDCSGFVQMLYRHMNIFLPRDAQDQFVYSGFSETPIGRLQGGDLIFWGYSKDEIRHVGLALGDGLFIHTSAVTENMPYLRISHISDKAWNGSGYYPFVSGRTLASNVNDYTK